MGKKVHTRLLSCSDLVAEEAIYHISCINRVRRQKNTSDKSSGRPIDPNMMRNFERVCQWLEEEGDNEFYTLAEIYGKMEELAVVSECYSKIYLKDQIFFALKKWQHGY